MKLDKKGQGGFDIRGILNVLLVVGIGLAVAGMILAFGAKVTSDVGDGFADPSIPKSITNFSLEGMENLTAQFTSIGTIGGAIVIIGLVLLIARFAGV